MPKVNGTRSLLSHPAVCGVAAQLERTPAQVLRKKYIKRNLKEKHKKINEELQTKIHIKTEGQRNTRPGPPEMGHAAGVWRHPAQQQECGHRGEREALYMNSFSLFNVI